MDDPLLASFDPNLDEGTDSISLDGDNETPQSLAEKCEKFRTDEERRSFFKAINKNSVETLELNCPAFLVLSHLAETKELRDELETFLIENLSHPKSRLVRKTCACALKSDFLFANDSRCHEFFVLLGSLEEHQFHVVEPSLEKLSTLANQILAPNCPLEWRHLRACFIVALRHTGWIQAATVLRILKLPKELFAEDYEFLINGIFESLCQYDFYWRVDRLCGLNVFLNDLHSFVEELQTREFYLKFLDFIARKLFPAPISLISHALPLKTDKFLDINDLPLARRVFMTINRFPYLKLRYNSFYNFFALFIRIFELENAREIEPLFALMPVEVQKQANQLLLDKFSETLDCSNKTAQTKEPTSYTEEDVPSLLASVQAEDANMSNSMKALVEIILIVDKEKQSEIVRTLEIAYADARKTSIAFEVSKNLIGALLATFESNAEGNLDRLFKILNSNLLSPQVAYTMTRQIKESSTLSTSMYSILIELAIYGEFPQKIDDVMRFAHELSRSFGLDEITEIHLLQKRTRENAIIALLKLALQNTETVDNLVLLLLQKSDNLDHTHIIKPFGLSKWHRKQTRLLSLLLIFIGKSGFYASLSKTVTVVILFLQRFQTHEQVRTMCLKRINEMYQQYSVKTTVEWILTFYCMRDEEFYQHWLLQAPTLALQRIGSVSSWIVSILRSLHTDSDLNRQRVFGFLLKTVPWITSQSFLVNIFSISSIKLLCKWHRGYLAENPSTRFAIELADFDVEVSGNTRKFVNSVYEDPFFEQLLPGHVDLFSMFYVLPKFTGMPQDELIFEKAPEDVLLERSGLTDYLEIDFSRASIFSSLSNTVVSKPDGLDPTKSSAVDEDGDFEIQQKLDTAEMQLKKKQPDDQKQLIVVASLIDKVANLGGLCRTLEIFNGRGLVVSNADIVNHKEFKGLSLHAEKLLPIIEVKPDELLEYLKKCREQGYSIVAAEQTSRSVSLEKFRFPEKAVLLLGHEKYGVPAGLIRYVDYTVEIPQLGTTRSLNVHVTGSLFIYTYAQQHLLSSE